MADKKASKPRTVDVNGAAELLGISPAELMQSRGRGVSPGKDGYKKDGVLVWNVKDLPKPGPEPEPEPEPAA